MKILFVFLFCFISTVANAEPLRIYLIYGDWPVARLAKQIRSLNSQYIVTTHHWKRHEDVIDSIRKLPVDKKVVIVGYSTGAMTTTLISNAIPDRQIELAIAYDSSTTSTVYLVAPNVKRFFYNNDGRAYAGSKVLVSDFREKLLSKK